MLLMGDLILKENKSGEASVAHKADVFDFSLSCADMHSLILVCRVGKAVDIDY